jgi:hypothetical protein
MNKKFEFTGETKVCFGITFNRIQAKISFGVVANGEIGGWIEKESNVSDEGDAWVSGDAWVYGNARVYGDAQVYGDAWVSGDAQVYGNAQVYGDARVSGDAQVYGNAQVYGLVVNLIGTCEFSVAAYAEYVQIGCKLHTIREWTKIFSRGVYQDLCLSKKSYMDCKAAFEYCKSLKQQRKDAGKMTPKKAKVNP